MGTLQILKEKGIKAAIGHLFSYVTVRNIYRFFGLFLIIVALSFYLGWSLAYDTWTDVGLYSFSAPVIVFGILILMLTEEKYKTQSV